MKNKWNPKKEVEFHAYISDALGRSQKWRNACMLIRYI